MRRGAPKICIPTNELRMVEMFLEFYFGHSDVRPKIHTHTQMILFPQLAHQFNMEKTKLAGLLKVGWRRHNVAISIQFKFIEDTH